MKGAIGGVLLGAALAVIVVACASSSPHTATSAAPPPSTTGQQAPTMPGDKHDQIQQLVNKLDADRSTLQLPEPQAVQLTAGDCQPTCVIEQMSVSSSAQDTTCHPATSSTCTQVCTLADSICTDSDKICNLARELANDPWAAGKCKEAQETCTTAHGRCCDCR